MRTLTRVGLALLISLALSTTAFAQTSDDRFSLSAAVGPSFATIGTTFSTTAAANFTLNDWFSISGEYGVLPHAALDDAARIAPPAPTNGFSNPRVNAHHWNGNVRVRPLQGLPLEPYVTAGIGSFTTDTVVSSRQVQGSTVVGTRDLRRATDFATNVGAGVLYRLNEWVGLSADYRTFFVHRTGDTPRVNRFTTGVTFSLP